MIGAVVAFFQPFKPFMDFLGKLIKPALKHWREITILILLWFLWGKSKDLMAVETDLGLASDTITELVVTNQTTEGSLTVCLETNRENQLQRDNALVRALAAEIRLSEMEFRAASEVEDIHHEADEMRELAGQDCKRLVDPMPDEFFSWVQDKDD